MGQSCCCLGGTAGEDEREVAPRAARRGQCGAAGLLRRCAADEAARRWSVVVDEEGERGVLAEEHARCGERAGRAAALRCQRECGEGERSARAALEAAAELSRLALREDWARSQAQKGEEDGWVQLCEAAAKAGTQAHPGAPRDRSSSSGRDSDGATPERESEGEWAHSAGEAVQAQTFEETVALVEYKAQGAFGLVFAGRPKEAEIGAHRPEGRAGVDLPGAVAVKIFATPAELEARTLWALDAVTRRLEPHPNLVTMYTHGILPQQFGADFFTAHSKAKKPPTDGPLCYHWVTMSQARRGLWDFIHWSTKKGDRLSVKALAGWVREAACGLAELHKHQLVHTDFKATNLLLNTSKSKSGICEVCDLDSVHGVGSECWVFTSRYLDPLIWASTTPITSFDWDVWSLGITAHMIFTQGSVPPGMIEAFEAAKQGKFVQVRAHLGLPAMMRSLLESCWLPTGQRSSAGSFAADCKPREMSKALPEDSSAYESFKSVMYARDNDFGAWLEKHEKVRT